MVTVSLKMGLVTTACYAPAEGMIVFFLGKGPKSVEEKSIQVS